MQSTKILTRKTLYPHQEKAIAMIKESLRTGHRRPMLQAPTGFGKCLQVGTPVLRFDGTIVPVETLQPGDLLMGPDSSPRTILSTCRNTGPLFRITPTKGDPWVCNDVHILTLVNTETNKVIDIPLDEYLGKSNWFKHCHKQFAPERGVDFASSNDPSIPGYFVGIWIGDGTKSLAGISVSKPDAEIRDECNAVAEQFDCYVREAGADRPGGCPTYFMSTAPGKPNRLLQDFRALMGNGDIPLSVLTASRTYRLEVLAGILDTDGHQIMGNYDIVQRSEKLADGIAFLARSLGYRATRCIKIVNGVPYHRLTISGETSLIPLRIERKKAPVRRQKKVATRTGFEVESIGLGEYAGFTLDGDGRFLLGDFTVTHNTLTAATIARGALDKGNSAIFVVPALSLIDQTVAAFEAEGIDAIGVMQASHERTDSSMPIQVASVQTLMRRKMPDAALVMIDEAHAWFDAYGKWMSDEWSNLPVIGLSATPWTRGLGRHYDNLLIPITTGELIEQGFLSPFRVFAPSHPDLSKVRTVAGDYHEGDLAEVMNQSGLVGDIVDNWVRNGEGRPTLCFAVNRLHAKTLQSEFEAAGVSTAYVDAYTSRDDRNEIATKFRNGDVDIVTNVGVLTKGVDWDVRCIILGRPTKSEMLFTQIIGRGLRTADQKQDCLIFDHTDTHLKLGFVTDIHHSTLDSGKERKSAKAEPKEALPKSCAQCGFVKPPKTPVCPSCGYKPEPKSKIECDDGELEEFTPTSIKKLIPPADKARFLGELYVYARRRGFAKGWAAHHYKQKFGHWPPTNQVPEAEPSLETLAWIKSRNIARAKSKGKRFATA